MLAQANFRAFGGVLHIPIYSFAAYESIIMEWNPLENRAISTCICRADILRMSRRHKYYWRAGRHAAPPIRGHRLWLRQADVKPWQWQFRGPSVMQMLAYASVCTRSWFDCMCVCVWVCACVCVSTPVYMQIFYFGLGWLGLASFYFGCSAAYFISCIKLTSIKCVVCIFQVCPNVLRPVAVSAPIPATVFVFCCTCLPIIRS